MSIKKTLHRGNTAFYSTANAGYAMYAATSLLTVRDQIPDASLYLLSSGLSENDKRILDKHNIIYRELDLTDGFTKTWDYPIDCYYMFAGPEFLCEQGYDYSVYIDGDVLCTSDPLQGLSRVRGIAGVASTGENGDYSGIFGNDWNQIKKIWSLPQNIARRKRVNAGVVYFNNHRMKSIDFLNTAIGLFQKSLKHNVPRKGDDSLFSLLQYVSLLKKDVTILPSRYNFVIQFNQWHYPIKDLVFFHFSTDDKPWKQQPFSHADTALNVFNPLIKQWRLKYKAVDYKGYIKSKSIISRKIYTISTSSIRFISKIIYLSKDVIYWLFGYKKSFITRRRNIKKSPIKLYWWNDYGKGIANFGDEVTKDILLKIYGYRTDFALPSEAELIGAGSILEIVSQQHGNNRPYVWGSGFMWKQENRAGSVDNLKFCAVRGAKSRSRLGTSCSRLPLGDPGLLANIIYKGSRRQSEKIGVVVHFIDSDESIVQRIKNDPRFIVINPLSSPQDVVLSITSCKFIFSSSLHGLIFADSFNIPNIHVQFSKKVAGGTYKFEDYYSATGREYRHANKADIFDNEYIVALKKSYQPVVNIRRVQKQLIKSFPNFRD